MDDKDLIAPPQFPVRTPGGYKEGDIVPMYGKQFRMHHGALDLIGDAPSGPDLTSPPKAERKVVAPTQHSVEPEQPKQGKVKPWWEIAKSFDPMMPERQYQTLKEHYFKHFVAPLVPEDSSISATWAEFDKQTRRTPVMSQMQHLQAPMLEMSEQYIDKLLMPLKDLPGGPDKIYEHLHGMFEKNRQLRARDGVDAPVAGMVGAGTGVLAGFVGLEKGMNAGQLIPLAEDLNLTGRAAEIFDRTMRGGSSFAAYEAAVANKEDKGVAALKGFALGAGIEGALGLATKLLRRGVEAKNVDKIVQDALNGGQVSPEVDQTITDHIVQDVKVAKREGRSSFLHEDPKLEHPQVHIKTHDGREVVETLKPGEENVLQNKVDFHTQQGGEVSGITYNPDHVGLVNKFLKAQERVAEGRSTTRTLSTEEGASRQVAAGLQLEGKAAEPVGENRVQVTSPSAPPPRDSIKEYLARVGVVEPALSNHSAQVLQLWNPQLPQKSAEVMLETLKKVVGAERLNPILPTRFKLPESSLQTVVGQKTPGMVETLKAMGEDSDILVEDRPKKIGKLYSLLDLPTIGDKYTTMQMEDLLSDLGHDPDLAGDLQSMEFKDAKALDDFLKSEEVGNALEEEVLTKSKDIKAPGAIEEAARKGEVGSASSRIPPSESSMVRLTPSGPVVVERAISSTPSRIGIQVSPEEMEQIYPGAANLTMYPKTGFYKSVEDVLGMKLDPNDPRPLHLYTTLERSHVWHENLHVGLLHAAGGERNAIFRAWGGVADEALTTAGQLAEHFDQFLAYQGTHMVHRIEEGFVHAATAIRTGDVRYLTELGRADTSVPHVMRMVDEFAQASLEMAGRQIDSAPVRNLQRMLEYTRMKASDQGLGLLREAASRIDAEVHFNPERGMWSLVEKDGTQTFLNSFAGLVDHTEGLDGSNFVPSASLPFEMRGVRGPMVPPNSGPMNKLPLPEHPIPKTEGFVGWKAISGAWRPMLPWVAGVHEKVNEVFGRAGRYLPLYEKTKAVDEAFKAGDDWMISNKEAAAKFLKGNPAKLKEYLDVLTAEQKHWPAMQQRLKLSAEDMINIASAENWLREFQADTHIPAFNYLREQLPRLRETQFNLERVYGGKATEAKDMSTFHRLIEEGQLEPKDGHLGRFINTMLREGFEKKFTGEPLAELKKIVDMKEKGTDKYLLGQMRWPLTNYVNYMKGIPDTTQQIIMRGAADFQNGLAKQFKKMNQYLPDFAKLPEEFNYPGNFVNRLMTLSYVGALGARPAIALRDAMQVLTTSLPVLGARFMRGASGVTSEGYKAAEEAGALLTKNNIGEMYGDIFGEMPAGGNMLDKATKLAGKLLAPSRWGHNAARAVAYNAEYSSALDAITKFRTGTIDAHDLLTTTSMWFYDRPVINEMLRMAMDKGIEATEVAKRSGLELVDYTLWPYRRGAQPALLRTGLGRIFGQYGMWPLNYLDFLGKMANKFHEFPAQTLKSVATWSASNYAAVAAMNGMGADVGKWFWVSPAGYGGSPHLELVQSLAKSFEETEDGRKARQKVLEYPLMFLPTSNEIKSIIKAMEDGGPAFDDHGKPTPNLMRVLGFKPLDEAREEKIDDMSLTDRAKYETGYKQVR